MRASNPASNEALLSASAAFVVENKFDLKALMKAILRSNAYQRSSHPLAGNRSDRRFYSRYYPRRMMAEVLHDAIVQVTEVPTKFDSIGFPGNDHEKTDFYPLGTRAVQLYDAAVENYFLQAFGRNPRRIVCECERSDEPTMVQVLHLSNGSTLNEKLKAPGNRLAKLLRLRREGMSDAAMVDEIYLACLSRYPDRGRAELAARAAAAPGRCHRSGGRRGHLLGDDEQPRVPVQPLTGEIAMPSPMILAVLSPPSRPCPPTPSDARLSDAGRAAPQEVLRRLPQRRGSRGQVLPRKLRLAAARDGARPRSAAGRLEGKPDAPGHDRGRRSRRCRPRTSREPDADEIAIIEAWIASGAQGPQGEEPAAARLAGPQGPVEGQGPAGRRRSTPHATADGRPSPATPRSRSSRAPARR